MNVALKPAPLDADGQQELIETLFRPMGVDGVLARTGRYEAVVRGLEAFIDSRRPAQAAVLRFPPVMSRKMIERSGYLNSFPNLLGCMCCLTGSEREITGTVASFNAGQSDWTDALAASDLVLSPASCYPIYPMAAQAGPVPRAGLWFDVACDCFRREPSKSIDRLQSFRMREFVRIGTAEQILAFRAEWIERAQGMADELGLAYGVDVANDPFFGRGGEIMAASQVQLALKFELLVPVVSATKPTACMSFNYHLEHFTEVWDMRDEDGAMPHSGCVAFGMDRLAVAMFATHGLDPALWPAKLRRSLQLT